MSDDLSDAVLLNALEKIEGRIVIDCDVLTYPGDPTPALGWAVTGGGLRGAFRRTLRESLTDFTSTLVKLSAIDPSHYDRFADLLPKEAPVD